MFRIKYRQWQRCRPGLQLLFLAGVLFSAACESFTPEMISPERMLVPSAPVDVSIEPGNRLVILSWDHTDSLAVDRFRIYRSASDDSTGAFVRIAEQQQRSYRDQSVVNNITYTYEIAAVSESGVEGRHSPAVSVTPLSLIPDAILLREPTLVDNRVAALNLRWLPTNEPNFKSYVLMRSAKPPVSLASTFVQELGDRNLLSFTDISLDPDTRYYYRVYVFNLEGRAAGSNTVSGKTLENFPPARITLSQPARENFGLQLTWTQNLESDFANYRVYRSQSSPVDTTAAPLVVVNDASLTRFIDETLAFNVRYHYVVLVSDRFGLSTLSNEVEGIYNQ